jgi:hypothetical protein
VTEGSGNIEGAVGLGGSGTPEQTDETIEVIGGVEPSEVACDYTWSAMIIYRHGRRPGENTVAVGILRAQRNQAGRDSEVFRG